MNPSFLDSMSWSMAEVYGAITDQILINLARYFPEYTPEKVPTSAFSYQANMLAQMGKVNKETIAIIKNGLGDADNALRMSLEQAIVDAVRKAQPELLLATVQGILDPEKTPIVSPNQTRAFQLYYKQSATKLNHVNTVMLESTRQAYTNAISDVVSRINATQSALNIGAGEVVTGVSSWNQAVRHAVNRMTNNGIVGFIDHAGHRWSAEAYVAMDIRTTVMNTGRAAVWETNEDFGNDLYQVSYHDGARPLCYPWQNKVISANNRSGVTYDLDGNQIQVHAQSETTYGQAAGLFGINCGHYPNPFIPGVSVIRGTPQNEDDNKKTYAESQEQRRLERKLREEKRDLLMAKERGVSQEEIDALRERVNQSSRDIDDFCQQTGRARHRDREAVFTKREFPEKEKYDVSAFENSQKDLIKKYFETGGAQQEFTFNELVPNVPIVPNVPTVSNVPVQNVASQATTNTYTVDMFNKVGGMKADAQKEMAKTLLASGNNDAIQLFGKYADELKVANPRVRTSAYFSPRLGGIAVNVKNAIAGSDYEEPLQVLFHEFAHNIDWLAGGKNNYNYLSNIAINGKRLGDVIMEDYKAFMAQIGANDNLEVIKILKAENMDKKTCGNISDILEACTHKSYPLGIGHGASYHNRPGATEKEFFAEVLDSSITNSASYGQMKRLFPNAVDMVWNMVKGAI